MDYWMFKESNIRHAREVMRSAEEQHGKEVEEAVQRVILYPELEDILEIQPKPYPQGTEILMMQCVTVDAAFHLSSAKTGGKICLLDFASYKEPGGLFLQGSLAQEESLCHESLLYPVLDSHQVMAMFYLPHKKMLNCGLYHSDLLYLPGIPFFRKGSMVPFDVIVCAAPNKKTAQRYQGVSDEEAERAMQHRIDSVLYAAWDQGVEVLVLGAFGCGVFGNDLVSVSRQFAKLLKGKYKNCFREAVFAVPDGKSYITMRDILDG